MDERGTEDGRSPRGQEVKIAKRKPWGCEFLAYENDNVAIWHLLIDPWAETSLHCHPNKKTGLIVLQGGAKVCFLSGGEKLFAGEKVMIREGVFHRTVNMTSSTLHLYEIESPVDKSDLVRIDDKYDRGTVYTDEDAYLVDIKCPWEDNKGYYCDVKIEKVDMGSQIRKGNYLILTGGIRSGGSLVCAPGDIVSGDTFAMLSTKFETLETEAIYVVNEKNRS